MKKIYILLIIFLAIQVFAIFQWNACRVFVDDFHFSSFDLELRLIEGIHNDVGVPLTEVRMFHNKVTGSLLDIFGHYLQFWNITFLAKFISLAGVVGVGAGLYYFFTKKKNLISWNICSSAAY